MSAMTMSAPDVGTTSYGSPQVIVTVLNEDGRGYLLSLVEFAFDTGMPECMAFKYADGVVTSWQDEAVSYEPTRRRPWPTAYASSSCSCLSKKREK